MFQTSFFILANKLTGQLCPPNTGVSFAPGERSRKQAVLFLLFPTSLLPPSPHPVVPDTSSHPSFLWLRRLPNSTLLKDLSWPLVLALNRSKHIHYYSGGLALRYCIIYRLETGFQSFSPPQVSFLSSSNGINTFPTHSVSQRFSPLAALSFSNSLFFPSFSSFSV